MSALLLVKSPNLLSFFSVLCSTYLVYKNEMNVFTAVTIAKIGAV